MKYIFHGFDGAQTSNSFGGEKIKRTEVDEGGKLKNGKAGRMEKNYKIAYKRWK